MEENMYVYVRYIRDNIMEIVESSKIKHFDKDQIDFNKKYLVQWEDGEWYHANIIFFAECKEDLEKLINQKRVRLKRKDMLVTDTEEDDLIEETPKKLKKSPLKLASGSSENQKMKIIKKGTEKNILDKFDRQFANNKQSPLK